MSNTSMRADSYNAFTRNAEARLLARLLLFSLYLLSSTGCSTYLVVSDGAVNQDKLQEVKRGVVAIRGLNFRGEVPVEVMKRDEIGKFLEADLLRDYGEQKIKDMALAYAKLGLLPQGFDLKKSLLDLYAAEVAAFYDPRAKKLVFPEDMAGGFFVGAVQFLVRRDIMGEMVLAHELTHALQDQHFSLEKKLDRSDDDDRTLSFRAVIEGDATLSGFSVVLGRTDAEFLSRLSEDIEGQLKEKLAILSEVPEAILQPLLFQYYGGVALVYRVLREKGWAGVDRLYASPPLSTEQVLHPEKYLVEPDPPTRIDLRGLSSLFSADWQEIENNNLGELMAQVLFKRFLPEEEAERIAQGWDGDRFVAFRRGEEAAFVWATVWDSPKDAEELLRGYLRVLAKKYGHSDEIRSKTYLERRDQRVVVVEGLDRRISEENIEKIWQGMELKEGPFQSPFPLR